MRVTSLLFALAAVCAASPISGNYTQAQELQRRQGADNPYHKVAVDTRYKTLEEQWQAFHHNSNNMAAKGECRAYLDPAVRAARDGKWPCYSYCVKKVGWQGPNEHRAAQGCNSMDVPQKGTSEYDILIGHTPDGDAYMRGECICASNAQIDGASDLIGEVLVELTQSSCAIFLNAVRDGAEGVPVVLSLLTGGASGVVAKSIKAVINFIKALKKAQTAYDLASDSSALQKMVEKVCKVQDYQEIDWTKAFQNFEINGDAILGTE